MTKDITKEKAVLDDLRYLQLLSRSFPTIADASTEIINLEAILNLPKGTEHFLSDLHGEYQAFNHVLRNASGSIKRKVGEIFSNTMRDAEKKELYQKVRQCISEMKAEWREVILYCCVLQYTSEEAGKILGISATACRSRLLRAREYIKKTLGDEFHEYFD